MNLSPISCALLTALWLCACKSGDAGGGAADMAATVSDMAKAAPDLRSAPADLRGPAEDLARPPDLLPLPDMTRPPDLLPPPDLTPPPPMLAGVNCAQATVNANDLWSQVVSQRCGDPAGNGCHLQGNNMGDVNLGSVDALRATVNKKSNSDLLLIKPNDIHQSYILYKLTDQQTFVPGGFGQYMPRGRGFLPNNELCMFVNWVRSGAN